MTSKLLKKTYCKSHLSLDTKNPIEWKFMVCVVGCLNIAAHGSHKP